MKILKIEVCGLPLFKDDLIINFTTLQRVAEDDKDNLYPLFSNIYLNPTHAIIGINASGKTSILKVILLVLGLIKNEPINHMKVKDILGNTQEACITVYFISNTHEICKLKTTISCIIKNTMEKSYIITNEYFWKKKSNTVKTKKYLFDFDGVKPYITRDGKEMFLSEDISIIIAYNKENQENFMYTDLLSFTNINILPEIKDIPVSIITFLDPSIELLSFEKLGRKNLIHLKFKNKEEFFLNNAKELENYLSSGTIKGIITLTMAIDVLKNGGYMIIDEIENHFNKEIAATIIRFFLDTTFNKNGASLIYTTHYPEILDEYDRNDSIFIAKNINGITLENLSTLLKRNDIKKSDVFQSSLLTGTAPSYKSYIQLKKSIASIIQKI